MLPVVYRDTDTGAPVLTHDEGGLLAVLRPCLVQGYGVRAVQSITVSAGVATVTAADHGYSDAYGSRVQVQGAPVAGLNGMVQPRNLTTNTFAYDAPGVADGTYVGSMTARRPPLGWTEPFGNAGQAVFARSDPRATQMVLRVVDPAGSTASVQMGEGATAVDALLNPTNAGTWRKGENFAGAGRRWILVGNERFFYLGVYRSTSNVPSSSFFQEVVWFGDAISYAAVDPWFAVLLIDSIRAGWVTDSYALTEIAARSVDGQTRPQMIRKMVSSFGGLLGHISAGQAPSTPVAIAAPVYVLPSNIGTTGAVRGEMPGLANPLARAPFAGLGTNAVVESTDGQGRKYLSMLYTAVDSGGNLLIELDREWHP